MFVCEVAAAHAGHARVIGGLIGYSFCILSSPTSHHYKLSGSNNYCGCILVLCIKNV